MANEEGPEPCRTTTTRPRSATGPSGFTSTKPAELKFRALLTEGSAECVEIDGGFNRSVQHGRFWVLSGPEVHKWRDWVVQEGCRRQAKRSCGSGGGPGSP